MPRYKYHYSGKNSYDLHSGGLLGIPPSHVGGVHSILFVKDFVERKTFTVSLLRPTIYLNVFIKQMLTTGVTAVGGFCIVRSTNK